MPQLVIGLGNPGGEYTATRHNVGWRCLDELERMGRFTRQRREGQARVSEGSIDGFDVVLGRPTTYMNLSGRAGVALAARYSVAPEDVIVVHDDLDLAIGRVQVKRGGGAGGQKGVLSLINSWRTREFIRVRIGIGRPPEGIDAADHVLDPFHPDERAAMAEAVRRAAEAVVAIIRSGVDEAMNTVNQRPAG